MYNPEENHQFKHPIDFGSEFVVHHRRKGTNHASYSTINNSYMVTSFNIMFSSQGDIFSQTTLVIYDLEKREVIHRITQANTTVNMATNTLSVNLHPKYERVCITTDIDGQIIFWDCCLGVALRVFQEHATHVGLNLEANSVSDSNFSKCGNLLVVGTNYGSFSVYGYGGSEFYESVDMEQFTSIDYTGISVLPDTYQIVGTESGLLMGEADEGTFKCNFNMTPHQIIPEGSSYEVARNILDEKANSLRYKFAEMKKVDDNSQKDLRDVMIGERRRAIEARKRLVESIRSEGLTVKERIAERNEPEVEGAVVPPSAGHFQAASSQALRTTQREMIDAEMLSEDSPRGRRRLRRANVSESSVSEDDLQEDIDENDMELDYLEDEDDIRRRRRSTRIMRTHRNHSSTLHSRPGPRTRRSGRIGDAVRLGKRDIADNIDDDSEEFYQNFGRNRKCQKAYETLVMEEEHFCTRCRQIGASERCMGASEPCSNIYHQECSDLCGADIKEKFMCFDCVVDYYFINPRIFEYSKLELEDGWLDIQGPDPDMMTPQIGDKYYFVFQPYEQFVSKFFDILNFKKGDLFWPWRKFAYFQQREVLCQVESIEYEFPNLRGKKIMNDMAHCLTIIMRIKLRILDPDYTGLILEGDNDDTVDDFTSFEIKYFPASDTPAFLIWHKQYEKAVRDYQSTAAYSEIKYGDEYYNVKEVIVPII